MKHMRRAVARALPAALVLALAAALAPVACADVFEPIQLVSAGPLQQADFAHDAAISGDGRYVAFDGSYGARFGVWRRDLRSGAVEAVAECPPTATQDCALRPSISADGRWVSFTTNMRLDPLNDTNNGPDVYVRDMESHEPCLEARPEGEPCEYELASAVSGAWKGLTYTYGTNFGEERELGSVATGRSAITADGRHVVFETTATSDLAGEATPAYQLAVRDLGAYPPTTRLVTVRYDAAGRRETSEPVPLQSEGAGQFGAVYPSGTAPGFRAPWIGGSISADGSTVAWMGQEIAAQARTLPAEGLGAEYTEPLWRRIADGPQAPIRRVTGGGDPESAACIASGERAPALPPTLADPCQGPFDEEVQEGFAGVWEPGGRDAGNFVPQLNADGSTVAFLATARELAGGETFAKEPPADVYVANMAPGLTRVKALRKLTELAGGNLTEPSRTAPVTDLGISADGHQVAFATRRTVFALGSPAYVSPPAAEAAAAELYDADLANDTLTRVTQGFEGEPSGPSRARTGSPSFSSDGTVLAFSSAISNLVFGDGNAPQPGASQEFDGSDAFLVHRRVFTPQPARNYISPEPGAPAVEPAWLIFASARSLPDGSVAVEAVVPGAGSLKASAVATVPVTAGSAARSHRRPRRGARRLVVRTVATAEATGTAAGPVSLVLHLSSAYRPLAAGGLGADVLLTFTAAGHPQASGSLQAAFSGSTPATSTKRSRARRSRRAHQRRKR